MPVAGGTPSSTVSRALSCQSECLEARDEFVRRGKLLLELRPSLSCFLSCLFDAFARLRVWGILIERVDDAEELDHFLQGVSEGLHPSNQEQSLLICLTVDAKAAVGSRRRLQDADILIVPDRPVREAGSVREFTDVHPWPPITPRPVSNPHHTVGLPAARSRSLPPIFPPTPDQLPCATVRAA